MNLSLYSHKKKSQRQTFILISNINDEFLFVEKLIFNYMTQDQTWILQKAPLIVF